MVTEVLVPTNLKSDVKLSVGRWFKRIGDPVSRDEPLVEVETDDGAREISAPVTGVLSNVLVHDGASVDRNTCSERLPKTEEDPTSHRLRGAGFLKSYVGSALYRAAVWHDIERDIWTYCTGY
jgi:pyruvate/2-oxoglutarate dehydrogenase complex dihydrolipoamide acyltransferase (E2) component